MKYILITLSLLLGAIALLPACKSNKYAADKLPPKQLRWGSGGGFVGKETAHILCDNGQIFARDMMGAITKSGRTKSANAKTLFKTAETLSKLDFQHPGNTYSFLEWQDGDMVRRIVWGEKGIPVDKSVQDLYNQLNGMLK
ncbi:MAG TPA: hypothetical protein DCF33_00005 [Saprospirales bacterium]|nr:hypothetical protein [Saprospirales bacterium]